MNRYQQRDAVLRTMGFSSYAEYLASPLWRSIRARLFKVCDQCPCGKKAEQAHHRTYKRRYLEGRGKIHKFITPICGECHEEIEFEGGEKLSLGWANSKLDAIRDEAESRGIILPRATRIKRKSKKLGDNSSQNGKRQEGMTPHTVLPRQ